MATEDSGRWMPVTKGEALLDADLPPNPEQLDCRVCDTPIGGEAWDWAAMPENGPVHARCFMTDAQLLEQLDNREPCTGCDTTCAKFSECTDVDVLSFGNGVDNCMIVRPGPELDHVAEQYRAHGYKVVH